jgi:hypothetical protein
VRGERRGMAGTPRTRAFQFAFWPKHRLLCWLPIKAGRNTAAHIYRRTMECDDAPSYGRFVRATERLPHPPTPPPFGFRAGLAESPSPDVSRTS